MISTPREFSWIMTTLSIGMANLDNVLSDDSGAMPFAPSEPGANLNTRFIFSRPSFHRIRRRAYDKQ
eukprot:CAMPEP_0184684324 /NCGR_PEP_ID=MMETSP0312-20130426/14872_1 /TAXON_ID=31354 /ORGANISM="Compsopogon coeruleus, Strain SAG 36.94" /LENGTH=66 /DNA_ID=CAMNT_0027137409 /DNA_START=265 /DNA_END=465 /DNA_ORIENTATION=-